MIGPADPRAIFPKRLLAMWRPLGEHHHPHKQHPHYRNWYLPPPQVSVEAASQTSTRAPLPAQALDLMPQAAAVPSGAVGHGAGDSTAQVSEEDEGAVRQPMQQLATSGADRINGGRGGDVDGAGMNVDALAEGDAVGGISEADSGGAHPADEDEAAGTLRGLPVGCTVGVDGRHACGVTTFTYT